MPFFRPQFLLLLALAACATTEPPARRDEPAPARWQASLPVPPAPTLAHHGDLADLRAWWRQWNDPLLLELIDAAQSASPTLDAASARLRQARASLDLMQANLGPSLDASVAGNRGRQTTFVGAPIATVTQARVQASWETDLFGQNRALRDAAGLRLQGAQTAWHEARISLAADVANLVMSQRACAKGLAQAQADADSRAVSARLAQAQSDAGFSNRASAALASSAAAESRSRTLQQAALCAVEVKGLVALTGLDESALQARLDATASQARRPDALALEVHSVPAQLLAQRPDLHQADLAVAAAGADLGSAQAERYPRLSLSGAVGQMNLRMGGSSLDLSTWSIGPLTLSLPLWDNGRYAANLDAAAGRYDEAAANYRAKARQAVREVEEALVNLDSARAREDQLRAAASGYAATLDATALRREQGLAPRTELEETRRANLAAQGALTAQERDTALAWIALYRAVGGGWRADAPAPATPQASAATRAP